MPETVAEPFELKRTERTGSLGANERASSTSLLELWAACRESKGLFLGVVGVLLGACAVYCLFAPKEFEATARVALRNAPESALAIDRREAAMSGSFASGQVQLETLANVLRSEQVAWDVIQELKLYSQAGFSRSFPRKFPEFTPDSPSADAKDYLLEEFGKKLTVQSAPHTLVLEIRFRSRDPRLSADVANAIVQAYARQEMAARMQATESGTEWLNAQLRDLKKRIDGDDLKLAKFQTEHGILRAADATEAAGSASGHSTESGMVDGLSRELASATADRIVREAEYRAATAQDPELTEASYARSSFAGNSETALLRQLHARKSDLEQEKARLEIEHGPNFPRAVEIRGEMQDLDAQIRAADEKLVDRFRSAWRTSVDREQLLRRSLKDAVAAELKVSGAELQYSAMRQEANANREVYVKLMQQAEEAGLAAGSHGSALSVIDRARQPVEPVSPNPLVDFAITSFVSFWAALGAVKARKSAQKRKGQAVSLVSCVGLGANVCRAQTPSTSGLPTGVARIPQSAENHSVPNAKEAPVVWSAGQGGMWAGTPPGTTQPAQTMAAPIGPGDMLEVTEAHGPEMRVAVRVSAEGTVMLPMAGEVHVGGKEEQSAAHAIEDVLRSRGILLHPQVTVLVTSYAGQDVSVLGEVVRPGVYAYAVHHRLLDVISQASGLSQNAGHLVIITHRHDPESAVAVVLDPQGKDAAVEHNPELLPGDTVQVNRAGLIYVVGDVIRPGGFPVDPAQTATVVQALSLAWGPGQNAALKNAVLIREQPGGRTVTTLNLKRMLRGLDPDVPVRDRDILYVPDSMAKNLWNRSLESVVQSAAGVSIYSGLVYSQRF